LDNTNNEQGPSAEPPIYKPVKYLMDTYVLSNETKKNSRNYSSINSPVLSPKISVVLAKQTDSF